MKAKFAFASLLVIFLIFNCPLFAGQPHKLVRTPTAGLLEHRYIDTQVELLPNGEVMLGVNAGFFGRAQIGVSYGGFNILSYDHADFHPHVGFEVKARILDEDINYPGVVLGINTQGMGYYNTSLGRYQYKSPGPYLCVSKNWWALNGNAGVHGGINYTLETEDEESISFFVGVDKDYENIFGLNAEYDISLADFKDNNAYGEGKGYLNVSLWWQITDYLKFDLLFLDILQNQYGNKAFGRGFRVTFLNNY